MAQSTGDQALELLQHLCANDLDVPVGHIVHTGMLNERGGYENDCSVVRLSKNRFETSVQWHCRYYYMTDFLKIAYFLICCPASSSSLQRTSRSTVGPG